MLKLSPRSETNTAKVDKSDNTVISVDESEMNPVKDAIVRVWPVVDDRPQRCFSALKYPSCRCHLHAEFVRLARALLVFS